MCQRTHPCRMTSAIAATCSSYSTTSLSELFAFLLEQKDRSNIYQQPDESVERYNLITAKFDGFKIKLNNYNCITLWKHRDTFQQPFADTSHEPHILVRDPLKGDLPSYLELELYSFVSVLQSGHSEAEAGPQLGPRETLYNLSMEYDTAITRKVQRCLTFVLHLFVLLYPALNNFSNIPSTAFRRSKNCFFLSYT